MLKTADTKSTLKVLNNLVYMRKYKKKNLNGGKHAKYLYKLSNKSVSFAKVRLGTVLYSSVAKKEDDFNQGSIRFADFS